MQKKGFHALPVSKVWYFANCKEQAFFIPNCKSLGLIECTLLLACSQIKFKRNCVPGRHQIQLIQDFMFVCFNWVGSNRVQTYKKKPTYIEKKSYTKDLTKL